jgi:hypothetical protein
MKRARPTATRSIVISGPKAEPHANQNGLSPVLHGRPPGPGEPVRVLIPQLLGGGIDTVFLINPFRARKDGPRDNTATGRFNPLAAFPGPDDPDGINALANFLTPENSTRFFSEGARAVFVGCFTYARTHRAAPARSRTPRSAMKAGA